MEEAVDSGTRGEDNRSMVENVDSLTAELFWGNAYNLNKWIVVNFNFKAL
jgi:hypothetical protein